MGCFTLDYFLTPELIHSQKCPWIRLFESSVIQGNKQNMKNLRSRLVVLCAVDESGKRIFNDSDADALGKKSAAAVDRLFTAASKHNGFSSKDIEELEGE